MNDSAHAANKFGNDPEVNGKHVPEEQVSKVTVHEVGKGMCRYLSS